MRNNLYFLLVSVFIVLISCENEPIGEIEYTTEYIEVDSELYNLIYRVSNNTLDDEISCIDFNYPFALFVFDENQEFIEAVGISNDVEFQILLSNLLDGESVSLSFPITGTTSDGTLIEINNNEDLLEAINNCVRQEAILECNGILTTQACTWNILSISNSYQEYNGSTFKINLDGSLNFYFENAVYFGTWITYFVDDDLRLNINLNDMHMIGNDWNLEWDVTYDSNDLMRLENSLGVVEIHANCESVCDGTVYKECELQNDSGVAEFNLNKAISCLGIQYHLNDSEAISITFYESETDAILGENAITEELYSNVLNPQQLFARIVDRYSESFIDVFPFSIEAIPCEE
ncbi:MAG: hypothetical protein MK211_04945 [Flavobacteriales bacterium]|jgi:hypothetical protein|uniref:hypothetical protein n=1 Tax=Candidatus Ulvibacter alkanivorans TaxID=2267620 RepID=UPI000DF39250|nr:hypothetical protein [Candidatus Ulvibacter alkanivorans]MCH2489477.1 hypothetical protein [Flavobacteriales bacterium]